MIRNIFLAIVFCAMVRCSSIGPISHRNRDADTCGLPNGDLGFIVHFNGQKFPRGSFPWIVALLNKGWTPPDFICAGTLISKRFVISGNFLRLKSM